MKNNTSKKKADDPSAVFHALNNLLSNIGLSAELLAKEFYGKTLGLEVSSGPEGTAVLNFAGGTKTLMYPNRIISPSIAGISSLARRPDLSALWGTQQRWRIESACHIQEARPQRRMEMLRVL